MNRRSVEHSSRRSDALSFPTPRKSILHTCRCYTHFGASQDSRAGTAQ
ncbi:hypothetical protein [Phytobacter massiliensis]